MSIFNHDYVQYQLAHHGGVGLFVLLALGIFGLPIPDETLLILSGYLVAKGKLSPIMIPMVAVLGSCFGITLSYLFGFIAGKRVLLKYGKWVGISEKKLAAGHAWFEKFGIWLLLIGYYIPGVRHLTGITAGTVYLSYFRFALFAYVGATIWASTFLLIGYFFYNAWHDWNF